MTMKPKARKFRIRRSKPLPPDTGNAQSDTKADARPAVSAGKAEAPASAPASKVAQASKAAQPPQPHAEAAASDTVPDKAGSQNIDDIRNEGLTGRQLRMARRMAQKHGLAPTSDLDAVRLLRAKGIDPFQRSRIIELVVKSNEDAAAGAQSGDAGPGKIQLPQTVPAETVNLPATELSPADRRAQEIMHIQRDIAKRRRRKLLLLFSRLAAFVFLPTLIVGYYYAFMATPMYSSKSAFLILSADGSGGGAGGFFQGTSFATSQDAIATQEYLESKDAMLRLDSDVGFRAHFSQQEIDPLQRLDPDASNESAYSLYKKYIKLGYDPTEGVIRMEVATADPQVSTLFSERLIQYAEERVDQLSSEKRQDAVKTAIESLEQAKQERREAQLRLVQLQEGSFLDPEGEIASIRNLMSNVDLQLQEKKLALSIQLNNARPNRSKVAALESEIAVLTAERDKQSARLTQAAEGSSSLASQTADIQMAQADLATADIGLQAALETKRQSEIEANKQVRYLTVSVKPIASEDPSYPLVFENTVLAFLIFAGIYLMVSLTASILREQVSA